jgi:hypothetical protein
LLPTFITECKAKFQLRISEKNSVIFPPNQVHWPPEVHSKRRSEGPRVSTAAKDRTKPTTKLTLAALTESNHNRSYRRYNSFQMDCEGE